MQVIIPMSGVGKRFQRAGYDVPKPLIEVDGKAMIEHVVDLFPGEANVTFICNDAHLARPDFRMREILERCCPSGRIVGIPAHDKGPVHAVLQAANVIDPEAPTIINYCDFTCYWDYADFKRFVQETGCDGAIPCYRGFHPHTLGSTYYAYAKETDGWIEDIQEKRPFTDDPTNEFASSGTYYFASGELALHYCEATVSQGLTVGGEFYVSLVYKPILQDRRRVAVYELQHFMQWGTPEDLDEYRYWSSAFTRMANSHAQSSARQNGTVMIPMAGFGTRFENAGYDLPKPLIPISGEPMVVRAAEDLPQPDGHVFVVRDGMPGLGETLDAIGARIPDSRIVRLDDATDGQARTCLLGLNDIRTDAPLTIGACDNGAIYDADALQTLLDDPAIDVIVWVARGYPGAMRNPEMYGWVDADGDLVRSVSVKAPLADPTRDPVVIGTFTFARAADFVAAAGRMIEREARVNGEYYVDTCINDAVALGLDCRIFEVDRYLCWGTPNDLRTFEYWQSCFAKWGGHPYRLRDDVRIASEFQAQLEQRYAPTVPVRPRARR